MGKEEGEEVGVGEEGLEEGKEEGEGREGEGEEVGERGGGGVHVNTCWYQNGRPQYNQSECDTSECDLSHCDHPSVTNNGYQSVFLILLITFPSVT